MMGNVPGLCQHQRSRPHSVTERTRSGTLQHSCPGTPESPEAKARRTWLAEHGYRLENYSHAALTAIYERREGS